MRRVEISAAIPMPRMSVPDTAHKRRRRNRRARLQIPAMHLQQNLRSARWLSLGLFIVCVYALVQIGQNEQFYLTQIPVEGVTSIMPSEIVQVSGLAGAHIFAANPSRAAANITSMPSVISATVTLHWPNEVLIRVQEDTPVAVWEQAGEQHWINKAGVFIPARGEAEGLLLVVAETELPLPVDEDGALLQGALSEPVMVGMTQITELVSGVNQLYFSTGKGLSFDDPRGWRVYMGTGHDMAQKLAVYNAIVADLEGRGLLPVYVSVSNKEQPYYRVAGG